MCDPVHDADWLVYEKIPGLHEQCFLKVAYPFHGEPGEKFWFLYQPGLSFYNGWDEYPEELNQSAMIQCRFEKILTQNEYSATISVIITEVRMLRDLYQYYPEHVRPDLFEKFEPSDVRPSSFSYQEWFHDEWNIQGDLGKWKLFFTDETGKQHLILMGRWDTHRDDIYIGNITES